MKKLFYIFISIGLFIGCSSSKSNSTKLDSDDFENKIERIETLRKEIKPNSEFYDAEFEMFNINGFHNQRTSLPGASSWDYKFVIKLDTFNISKWTNGMQEVEFANYDDSWTKEIIKNRKNNWKTHSEPQYFIRKEENVTMLVYKSEGIIFKRVANL